MEQLTDMILSYCGSEEDLPPCRPSPHAVAEILEQLRILLFPEYFCGERGCSSLRAYLSMVLERVRFVLEGQLCPLHAQNHCAPFLLQLPRVREALMLDLQAFVEGDPAAAGEEEVIVSYPGFYAIMVQRLAHILWAMGVPVLPRMMTEQAHGATGIDIHPGAQLGKAFFIDHGTGVVIGETAVIGDHVKLYQGVTLGALSTRGGQSLQGKKRHPTIGDAVTVYAGATILGGDTVVGQGAIIGANAFVTRSVEPGVVVIGYRTDP